MLKKVAAVLGLKGVLCVASLTLVALALVSYTATLTITPVSPFTMGATTDSWTIYVNDVDEVRYLPGEGTPAGSTVPAMAPNGGANTYAFRVNTDAGASMAVNITLTSPVNNSEFSKFEITVLRYNSSTTQWDNATLYDAPTGGSTKSYIDGLTNDYGYIQQSTSLSRYYLMKVVYSFDLVDVTTAITVDFNYTPLTQ
ncbi:MAG: hypothetical protein GWO20_06450 [Candidatus Korarchaeota archaeon]|nr:hypothetical protein [Candidatus Korarchaeota archaeon]